MTNLSSKFSFHRNNYRIHVTNNGSFSMIIHVLCAGYYLRQDIMLTPGEMKGENYIDWLPKDSISVSIMHEKNSSFIISKSRIFFVNFSYTFEVL